MATVSDLSALVMSFAAGFRDRNRVIWTIYRGRRGDRRPYRHAFASMGLPCAIASNLRLLLLIGDRLLLPWQSDKDFVFPLCGFAPSLFPRSTNATEGNLNMIKSPAANRAENWGKFHWRLCNVTFSPGNFKQVLNILLGQKLAITGVYQVMCAVYQSPRCIFKIGARLAPILADGFKAIDADRCVTV